MFIDNTIGNSNSNSARGSFEPLYDVICALTNGICIHPNGFCPDLIGFDVELARKTTGHVGVCV